MSDKPLHIDATPLRGLRVTERGPQVEAVQHHNQKIEQEPGKHLWIVTGMWRVDPAKMRTGAKFHLDTENLLTLEGPGCFWCEQVYTPELAAQPCVGHG